MPENQNESFLEAISNTVKRGIETATDATQNALETASDATQAAVDATSKAVGNMANNVTGAQNQATE